MKRKNKQTSTEPTDDVKLSALVVYKSSNGEDILNFNDFYSSTNLHIILDAFFFRSGTYVPARLTYTTRTPSYNILCALRLVYESTLTFGPRNSLYCGGSSNNRGSEKITTHAAQESIQRNKID